MNPEIKTTEYVAKLKDIKLSDSSRARIQHNLHEYAAFHSVREGETSRSIGVVPNGASLFSFKFASMPFVILLAVMIGGGTSLAAQGSMPGDFLYPVKIGFNENIREALAVSVDSEAKLQANLLEERLEEAQKLQAEGRLTTELSATMATNIAVQTMKANTAINLSSEPVQIETKAIIAMVQENFLALTNPETKLAAENATATDTTMTTSIATSKMSSDVATGLYDINVYQSDMTVRTEALVKVITQHQAEIDLDVKTDLMAKLDVATKLTLEASVQTEEDARSTLDKAALLTGEVESKLSTLGQVEIDPNTGIIIGIDFSIDPMIIDRGNGSGYGVPTDPQAAQ
ncbi:hypothetical protein K2P47_04990 [Patescibacteria group bacterium]|nr:hypothetical protein [Patescibacteria group bacterium]